jgi:putative salt-induced outer membrane protein YdiY
MTSMQKRLGLAMAMAGGIWAGVVRAEEAAKGDTAGWESEVVAGVSLADGNTESTLATVGLATVNRHGPNEYTAKADYTYGETTVQDADGKSVNQKNADNAKAQAQANHLFTARQYGYVQANGLYDDIADIAYRVIAGPGAGHYLVKAERTWLKMELGPSALLEEVGGEKDEAMLLRAAQLFEHKTTAGARVWESAEYLPKVDDFDAYLVNAEVGAESALTPSMNLRVVVLDRYDSQPAAEREYNDLSVTAGLVLKL